MKKAVVLFMAAVLALLAFAGCAGGRFRLDSDITVISREEGSGTRSAFIELFGIEEKDASGNKIDNTTAGADINSSTGTVLTNVAENPNAIGYVSLGVLNSTVKALKIDGVEATAANVLNGTYKISRPFNVATKGALSAAADDFLKFILSSDGQKVVEEKGYIPLEGQAPFTSAKPSGKVVVAGSSSVTPVMEKLKEAYLTINTNVSIEIQESDSTTGMAGTAEGICDIGMASRELKDSEIQNGLASTKIAIDGIAVIVNNENTFTGLTSEQVKGIYTGSFVKWSELGA